MHRLVMSLAFLCAILVGRAEVARPIDVRVEPLLSGYRWGQAKSAWDLGIPCFNRLTPQNTYCGCVSTALGMLMHYNRWPQSFLSPLKKVRCSYDGQPADYDLEGGLPEWGKMPMDPVQAITDTQAEAIGKLMRDISVSCESAFSTNVYVWSQSQGGAYVKSTITFMGNAFQRLKDRYGYRSVEGVEFASALYPDDPFAYSEERLKQLVIPCCDYGKPITLSIIEKTEHSINVHEIVVDGYGYDENGTFVIHANCGDSDWGKWFCPPRFDLDGRTYGQIGGGLYNILPDECGTIVSGRILDSSKSPVVGAEVIFVGPSGSRVVGYSREKGVYAVLLPEAGLWNATANFDGRQTPLSTFRVIQNETTQIDKTGDLHLEKTPVIGNVFGADLVLQAEYAESVAEVRAIPAGGVILGSTEVVLSTVTEDAVIRYTLDGSDPDRGSPLYEGPIQINNSLELKAKAFARRKNSSETLKVDFHYSDQASCPAGDSQQSPWLFSGLRGALTIDHYNRYTADGSDPEICYRPYECHSVWLEWQAPNSGRFKFKSSTRGADVRGYYWNNATGAWEGPSWWYPEFYVLMAVYQVSPDGSLNYLVSDGVIYDESTGSATTIGESEAEIVLEVKEGVSYRVLCACPCELSLKDSYYSESYWYYDANWKKCYYDPNQARLDFTWDCITAFPKEQQSNSLRAGKPVAYESKTQALAASVDAELEAPPIPEVRKSRYLDLFDLVTRQVGSKWLNSFELKPRAVESLREQVDSGAKCLCSAVGPVGVPEVTVLSTPGFYYSVEAGASLDAMEEGPRILSVSDTVQLQLPLFPQSGFYRLKVSVSDGP